MHYFEVLNFSLPSEGNSRFNKQERKEPLTLLSCSNPLGIAQELLLFLNEGLNTVLTQIRAKSGPQTGYLFHSFFFVSFVYCCFFLIESSKINLD